MEHPQMAEIISEKRNDLLSEIKKSNGKVVKEIKSGDYGYYKHKSGSKAPRLFAERNGKIQSYCLDCVTYEPAYNILRQGFGYDVNENASDYRVIGNLEQISL